jgi:predicted N-acetyltransferase YhbS
MTDLTPDRLQQRFTIRDARDDERPAIADLTLRAYAEYAEIMDPPAWRGLEQAIDRALASEEPADRLVADDEGTLIGSVLLYAAASNAYAGATGALGWPEVRLLSVPPEARGQGVASALMQACIERARASGATTIGIHTSRSMHVAMEMYKRMGFVRTPEHDFWPAGAEVVEGYRLSLG